MLKKLENELISIDLFRFDLDYDQKICIRK